MSLTKEDKEYLVSLLKHTLKDFLDDGDFLLPELVLRDFKPLFNIVKSLGLSLDLENFIKTHWSFSGYDNFDIYKYLLDLCEYPEKEDYYKNLISELEDE